MPESKLNQKKIKKRVAEQINLDKERKIQLEKDIKENE